MPLKNNIEKKNNIKKLEKLAIEILKFKQEIQLRRPILIEFCGTPKAGKSTCISSLNIFLKRNGFKTSVLTERASICPVDTKTHPFFNTWTLCSAICEMVKNLSVGKDHIDIIIADRAIFDSLCWFKWLNTNPNLNPHLTDIRFEALKNFILMDMWTNCIDIIYVFKVSPEKSLEREFSNLLTEKTGSIMNENVINGFNTAIDTAVKDYGNYFKAIKQFETSNLPINEVNFKVTEEILTILKDSLIEKIGYFDMKIADSLNSGVNNFEVLSNKILNFEKRPDVEDSNHIQPVVIAVITNENRNKVLTVKKNKNKIGSDSPEKDKLLLYVGGHIRIEDKKNDQIIDTFINALQREVNEELSEAISIKNPNPILIFSTDSEKSKKHLAVLFVVSMDLENTKFIPTSNEFIQKTGSTKSGHVYEIEEIIKMINTENEDLEFWSKIILQEIFKVDINLVLSKQNKLKNLL